MCIRDSSSLQTAGQRGLPAGAPRPSGTLASRGLPRPHPLHRLRRCRCDRVRVRPRHTLQRDRHPPGAVH
eukprot:1521936-Alexandrium_andersonii.AAC.1